MRTRRLQAVGTGLGLGVVLSLPALPVLGLVTGDVQEALATWPSVAVPLCALTTALGALAPVRPSRRRA